MTKALSICLSLTFFFDFSGIDLKNAFADSSIDQIIFDPQVSKETLQTPLVTGDRWSDIAADKRSVLEDIMIREFREGLRKGLSPRDIFESWLSKIWSELDEREQNALFRLLSLFINFPEADGSNPAQVQLWITSMEKAFGKDSVLTQMVRDYFAKTKEVVVSKLHNAILNEDQVRVLFDGVFPHTLNGERLGGTVGDARVVEINGKKYVVKRDSDTGFLSGMEKGFDALYNEIFVRIVMEKLGLSVIQSPPAVTYQMRDLWWGIVPEVYMVTEYQESETSSNPCEMMTREQKIELAMLMLMTSLIDVKPKHLLFHVDGSGRVSLIDLSKIETKEDRFEKALKELAVFDGGDVDEIKEYFKLVYPYLSFNSEEERHEVLDEVLKRMGDYNQRNQLLSRILERLRKAGFNDYWVEQYKELLISNMQDPSRSISAIQRTSDSLVARAKESERSISGAAKYVGSPVEGHCTVSDEIDLSQAEPIEKETEIQAAIEEILKRKELDQLSRDRTPPGLSQHSKYEEALKRIQRALAEGRIKFYRSKDVKDVQARRYVENGILHIIVNQEDYETIHDYNEAIGENLFHDRVEFLLSLLIHEAMEEVKPKTGQAVVPWMEGCTVSHPEAVAGAEAFVRWRFSDGFNFIPLRIQRYIHRLIVAQRNGDALAGEFLEGLESDYQYRGDVYGEEAREVSEAFAKDLTVYISIYKKALVRQKTYFGRDGKYLRRIVESEIRTHPRGPIKCLIVGASNGAEGYDVGVFSDAAFSARTGIHPHVEIVITDLRSELVAVAREGGPYAASHVLPEPERASDFSESETLERASKFFNKDRYGFFWIRKDIFEGEGIHFRFDSMDVTSDKDVDRVAQEEKFDFISLRHVAFPSKEMPAVLARMAQKLEPDGLIEVGYGLSTTTRHMFPETGDQALDEATEMLLNRTELEEASALLDEHFNVGENREDLMPDRVLIQAMIGKKIAKALVGMYEDENKRESFLQYLNTLCASDIFGLPSFTFYFLILIDRTKALEMIQQSVLLKDELRKHSYSIEYCLKPEKQEMMKDFLREVGIELNSKDVAVRGLDEEEYIHTALKQSFEQGHVLAVSDTNLNQWHKKGFQNLSVKEIIEEIAKNIQGDVERDAAIDYWTDQLVVREDRDQNLVKTKSYLELLDQTRGKDSKGYRYVIPIRGGNDTNVFDATLVLGHAGKQQKSKEFEGIPTVFLSEWALKAGKKHQDTLLALMDHEKADGVRGYHLFRKGERRTIERFWKIARKLRMKENVTLEGFEEGEATDRLKQKLVNAFDLLLDPSRKDGLSDRKNYVRRKILANLKYRLPKIQFRINPKVHALRAKMDYRSGVLWVEVNSEEMSQSLDSISFSNAMHDACLIADPVFRKILALEKFRNHVEKMFDPLLKYPPLGMKGEPWAAEEVKKAEDLYVEFQQLSLEIDQLEKSQDFKKGVELKQRLRNIRDELTLLSREAQQKAPQKRDPQVNTKKRNDRPYLYKRVARENPELAEFYKQLARMITDLKGLLWELEVEDQAKFADAMEEVIQHYDDFKVALSEVLGWEYNKTILPSIREQGTELKWNIGRLLLKLHRAWLAQIYIHKAEDRDLPSAAENALSNTEVFNFSAEVREGLKVSDLKKEEQAIHEALDGSSITFTMTNGEVQLPDGSDSKVQAFERMMGLTVTDSQSPVSTREEFYKKLSKTIRDREKLKGRKDLNGPIELAFGSDVKDKRYKTLFGNHERDRGSSDKDSEESKKPAKVYCNLLGLLNISDPLHRQALFFTGFSHEMVHEFLPLDKQTADKIRKLESDLAKEDAKILIREIIDFGKFVLDLEGIIEAGEFLDQIRLNKRFIFDPNTGGLRPGANFGFKANNSYTLIPHGQTDWNIENRYPGGVDISLNDVGQQQAKQIAENLYFKYEKDIRAGRLPIIYSSPLNCAYATAQVFQDLVRERVGVELPIHIEPNLKEMAWGDWSGKTKEECGQTNPELYERFNSGEDFGVEAPGVSESGIEALRRSEHVYEQLEARHQGQKLLIFGHGQDLGMMSFILGNSVAMDDRDRLDFVKARLDNAQFRVYAPAHAADNLLITSELPEDQQVKDVKLETLSWSDAAMTLSSVIQTDLANYAVNAVQHSVAMNTPLAPEYSEVAIAMTFLMDHSVQWVHAPAIARNIRDQTVSISHRMIEKTAGIISELERSGFERIRIHFISGIPTGVMMVPGVKDSVAIRRRRGIDHPLTPEEFRKLEHDDLILTARLLVATFQDPVFRLTPDQMERVSVIGPYEFLDPQEQAFTESPEGYTILTKLAQLKLSTEIESETTGGLDVVHNSKSLTFISYTGEEVKSLEMDSVIGATFRDGTAKDITLEEFVMGAKKILLGDYPFQKRDAEFQKEFRERFGVAPQHLGFENVRVVVIPGLVLGGYYDLGSDGKRPTVYIAQEVYEHLVKQYSGFDQIQAIEELADYIFHQYLMLSLTYLNQIDERAAYEIAIHRVWDSHFLELDNYDYLRGAMRRLMRWISGKEMERKYPVLASARVDAQTEIERVATQVALLPRQKLSEILGVGAIHSVLDVATGKGIWMRRLLDPATRPVWLAEDAVVMGTELSGPMVYFEDPPQRYWEDLTVIQNQSDPRYPREGTLDLINESFIDLRRDEDEEPEDYSKILTEYDRLLKPGGNLLIAQIDIIKSPLQALTWLEMQGYEIKMFVGERIPEDYPKSQWWSFYKQDKLIDDVYLIVAKKPKENSVKWRIRQLLKPFEHIGGSFDFAGAIAEGAKQADAMVSEEREEFLKELIHQLALRLLERFNEVDEEALDGKIRSIRQGFPEATDSIEEILRRVREEILRVESLRARRIEVVRDTEVETAA